MVSTAAAAGGGGKCLSEINLTGGKSSKHASGVVLDSRAAPESGKNKIKKQQRGDTVALEPTSCCSLSGINTLRRAGGGKGLRRQVAHACNAKVDLFKMIKKQRKMHVVLCLRLGSATLLSGRTSSSCWWLPETHSALPLFSLCSV